MTTHQTKIFFTILLAASSQQAVGMRLETKQDNRSQQELQAENSVHKHPVRGFCAASDGATFFTWSSDSTIKLWQPQLLSAPLEEVKQKVALLNTELRNERSYLLLLPQELRTEVYRFLLTTLDSKKYHCVKTFTGHTEYFLSFCLDTKDRLFSCDGKTLKFWQRTDSDDPTSYECVHAIPGQDSELLVDAEGILFSAFRNIRIWKKRDPENIGSYECIKILAGDGGAYTTLRMKKGLLFSSDHGGRIKIWQKSNLNDPASYFCVAILDTSTFGKFWIDSDELIFFNTYNQGNKLIEIWKKSDPEDPRTYRRIAQIHEDLDLLDIDSAGRLFCQSSDFSLHILQRIDPQDPTNYTIIKTLTGHRGKINACLKTTIGLLLTCSEDQTVKIWQMTKQGDPTTYECLATCGQAVETEPKMPSLSMRSIIDQVNQQIYQKMREDRHAKEERTREKSKGLDELLRRLEDRGPSLAERKGLMEMLAQSRERLVQLHEKMAGHSAKKDSSDSESDESDSDPDEA